MNWLRPIVIAVLLAFAGCAPDYDTDGVITHVTLNRTLTLRAQKSQAAIAAIDIAVSGSIVGSGEIQLMLNGAVYQRHEMSGQFVFRMGGDWYSPEAEVRYIPKDAKSGSFKVEAVFHSAGPPGKK